MSDTPFRETSCPSKNLFLFKPCWYQLFGLQRNSFHVLGVLNKELNKTHEKVSENLHLLKVEKNYILWASENGPVKSHSSHKENSGNLGGEGF